MLFASGISFGPMLAKSIEHVADRLPEPNNRIKLKTFADFPRKKFSNFSIQLPYMY